jgi:hypothetical protein
LWVDKKALQELIKGGFSVRGSCGYPHTFPIVPGEAKLKGPEGCDPAVKTTVYLHDCGSLCKGFPLPSGHGLRLALAYFSPRFNTRRVSSFFFYPSSDERVFFFAKVGFDNGLPIFLRKER